MRLAQIMRCGRRTVAGRLLRPRTTNLIGQGLCTASGPLAGRALPIRRPCRHGRPRLHQPLRSSGLADAAADPALGEGAEYSTVTAGPMTWPPRSHGAGSLRESHVGQDVTICGWVDRNRDMGGLVFLDVRDHTGVLQVCTRCRSRLEADSRMGFDALSQPRVSHHHHGAGGLLPMSPHPPCCNNTSRSWASRRRTRKQARRRRGCAASGWCASRGCCGSARTQTPSSRPARRARHSSAPAFEGMLLPCSRHCSWHAPAVALDTPACPPPPIPPPAAPSSICGCSTPTPILCPCTHNPPRLTHTRGRRWSFWQRR